MYPALVSAVHSASNPETILSSFRETGLVPFDPNVVLRQFHKKYLPKEEPIPIYSEVVKDTQIMSAVSHYGTVLNMAPQNTSSSSDQPVPVPKD
ncbi:hypothetical protein BLNAU_24518 [Blattamonas nauphoetae]|uniref:Uncharacterized protein n=1 Tax=Blattamonas nauphoetae TaxID=2049346 RepID=A0ABQ9WQ21_9EUKA|nr:hypothetical protein BLNAU_24518 [Blattamonas nauphoetae]